MFFTKKICNYGYRLWIILFEWSLVYNYFSAIMGILDIFSVPLYFCSYIEKSEHFVIKIHPQLLYWPNPLHWIFVITQTSIKILVAQKLLSKKLDYEFDFMEIHAIIHLFLDLSNDRLDMFLGWVIHFDVSFFNSIRK